MEQVPIVAWRIMPGGAVPVLHEEPASNQVVFLVKERTRFVRPGMDSLPDIETAKEAVLKEVQFEWDEENKNAAVD